MSSRKGRAAGPAVVWAEDAACLGRDVNEFFTKNQHRVKEIKNLCARCTVRQKCLAEALRAEDTSRYGIYGGLTPEERTELVARR
jgi:WhiB family redox-sensing transcriptional regulator